MKRLTVCFLSTFSLLGCNPNLQEIDPQLFYAPTIYADEKLLTISIPVEIEVKNGKESFVKLFELYGFSGNGPSIEQVVKQNIGEAAGKFDSEGDAFVVNASLHSEYQMLLDKIKCLEEVVCLVDWLNNSETILLKE